MQEQMKQLARMISNLIQNAIKFTDQGTVWLRLSKIQDKICLEVEDTGGGIEPQEIPLLFDRFYRGQSVRQSADMGTGLGLAIVKQIVDLHQGSIKVESNPGLGTKFIVEIPLNQR